MNRLRDMWRLWHGPDRLRCPRDTPGGRCLLDRGHDGSCEPADRVVAEAERILREATS